MWGEWNELESVLLTFQENPALPQMLPKDIVNMSQAREMKAVWWMEAVDGGNDSGGVR